MSASCSDRFTLSVASFLPGGTWTVLEEGETFEYSEPPRPMWIADSLSNNLYLNQPTENLRFKLGVLTGLMAGIMGGNAISLILNVAYRVLKIISLAHFWAPISFINDNQKDDSYNFKSRCIELAKDIIRIVVTPFAWIGLLFASLIGAIDPRENGPRDGAKIFSSIEVAMYGGTIKTGHFGWAPCYQSNATSHGLGGDINDPNAY